MTAVTIERFGGLAPKIDPRQLSDNLAQTAQNCILDGAALEPTKNNGTTGDTIGTSAVSMFLHNDTNWLSSTQEKTWAEVPIANDTRNRVVSTNASTYPEVYSSQGPVTYRLGVPAPSAAPTVDFSTASAGNPETISYVYTYVTAWGEEGPPSDPSTSLTHEADTDVELSLTPAPTGAYNWGAGALIRLYRSNGGSYQFVNEFAITVAGGATEPNGGDVTDNVDAIDLGEIIPTIGWIGPPNDDTGVYPNGPMKQIISLPNGLLAGFADNVLAFSEPFVYYAWPAAYRITFDEPVVGIAAIQSGVLVCTEAKSYVVTGVSPNAMATITLNIDQVCVARKSIVDMGDYALYASEEGLVLVQGTTAQLITEEFFDRADWQAYYPSNISAFLWEGKYLAFYTDGASLTAGFIFDPRGGVNAFTQIDDYYPVGHYDSKSNTTYIKSGTDIVTFGRGSVSDTYTWKSKKFIVPRPLSFAWLRIEAWDNLATSAVVVKVYADGSLVATLTMNDSNTPYQRLPAGFRAKIWELEITGSNPVTRIGLFESAEEMV